MNDQSKIIFQVSSVDFELETANLMLRHKDLIFHLLEIAVYDWTELYDIAKTLLERYVNWIRTLFRIRFRI